MLYQFPKFKKIHPELSFTKPLNLHVLIACQFNLTVQSEINAQLHCEKGVRTFRRHIQYAIVCVGETSDIVGVTSVAETSCRRNVRTSREAGCRDHQ